MHMRATSLHTCNCIHIKVYTRMHMLYTWHMYADTFNIYIQMYMCIQTHVHICMLMVMQVCVYANSYMIRRICTHNTICVCTCVQMRVHIHTDTYT